MIRAIKIILHLFYWVVFCLFSGVVEYQLAGGFDGIVREWVSYLFSLGWAIAAFYAFYFFFYRLIEKQRYLSYILASIAYTVVLSLALVFLYSWVFPNHPAITLNAIMPPLIGTLIICQTGSLLRGFIRWFEDIQHKQEMKQMLLRNELDMLNAQLNPHFLFNTLNNIDALIRSNPDKASESLITLSEIMRYMLYEAKKPLVRLGDEVVHYRNILSLQAMRLKDPSKVQFRVEMEDPALEVAPLLLLPFIENIFRHASFDALDAVVDIHLQSTSNRLVCSCANSLKKAGSNRSETGIGLANLKRRLELLYPDTHKLTINNDGTLYYVQLILDFK